MWAWLVFTSRRKGPTDWAIFSESSLMMNSVGTSLPAIRGDSVNGAAGRGDQGHAPLDSLHLLHRLTRCCPCSTGQAVRGGQQVQGLHPPVRVAQHAAIESATGGKHATQPRQTHPGRRSVRRPRRWSRPRCPPAGAGRSRCARSRLTPPAAYSACFSRSQGRRARRRRPHPRPLPALPPALLMPLPQLPP